MLCPESNLALDRLFQPYPIDNRQDSDCSGGNQAGGRAQDQREIMLINSVRDRDDLKDIKSSKGDQGDTFATFLSPDCDDLRNEKQCVAQ